MIMDVPSSELSSFISKAKTFAVSKLPSNAFEQVGQLANGQAKLRLTSAALEKHPFLTVIAGHTFRACQVKHACKGSGAIVSIRRARPNGCSLCNRKRCAL